MQVKIFARCYHCWRHRRKYTHKGQHMWLWYYVITCCCGQPLRYGSQFRYYERAVASVERMWPRHAKHACATVDVCPHRKRGRQ